MVGEKSPTEKGDSQFVSFILRTIKHCIINGLKFLDKPRNAF